MSLIKTEFGIFDPKKITFMAPIKEKNNEPGVFYFTIRIDGVPETIWVNGSREKVNSTWELIVKNIS